VALKNHIRLHYRPTPLICPICDTKMAHKEAQTLHLKNRHELNDREINAIRAEQEQHTTKGRIPRCKTCNKGSPTFVRIKHSAFNTRIAYYRHVYLTDCDPDDNDTAKKRRKIDNLARAQKMVRHLKVDNQVVSPNSKSWMGRSMKRHVKSSSASNGASTMSPTATGAWHRSLCPSTR